MPTTNPISVFKPHKFSPSSYLRSPRDYDATPRLWQKGRTMQQSITTLCNAVEMLQRQIERMRRRKGGGEFSGWAWGVPKVYDKDSDYSEGTVVIVRPTDDIVTVGAYDIEFDQVIKATPGTYASLQAVDRVNIGTEETPDWHYHVPQWTLFAADDPDSEDNYWWPISFYPTLQTICDENGEEKEIYVNMADKIIQA